MVDWLGDRGLDGAYYLVVSRLLPYKNVDAIVRAFAGTDRRLVVVGHGPEADRLRQLKTDNVIMMSDLSDGALGVAVQELQGDHRRELRGLRPHPLEAGVWGKPAIALRFGGFLDTIHEDVSGMYFDEPSPRAIVGALDRFESMAFDADKVRNHVKQFSVQAFTEKLQAPSTNLQRVGSKAHRT